MRLTREEVIQAKNDGPGLVTPGYWDALCDLALLGLAQEQNNAAGQESSNGRGLKGQGCPESPAPAAPDAAPQLKTVARSAVALNATEGEGLTAAAAPADRPTPRTDAALEPKMMGDCYYRPLVDFARQLERELAEAQDKIARMRPSEEAVKCAEQVITAERNAFPPIKGAKWGVGFLALTILRIDEEAK